MINYDNYKNPLPYPAKPSKPNRPCGVNPEEYRKHALALEVYQEEVRKWRELLEKYEDSDLEVRQKFKHDVLNDAGVLDNPKADILFRIAWEHGHYSGFSNVGNWVYDLAELIK